MTLPRKRWRTSLTLRDRARELRSEMTAAERMLWQRLRLRELNGARFRSQHAIGPFVVDFFCPRAKLVIEVDGDSHSTQEEYDTQRTRWLEHEKGLRVIRFNNQDVFRNIEAVLEEIEVALQ